MMKTTTTATLKKINIALLKFSESEKRVPSRIRNFIERTIPGFMANEFQSHFRLKRQSYEMLIQYLSPFLKKHDGSVGKPQIAVEKQILSALWLLATPDSYR